MMEALQPEVLYATFWSIIVTGVLVALMLSPVAILLVVRWYLKWLEGVNVK